MKLEPPTNDDGSEVIVLAAASAVEKVEPAAAATLVPDLEPGRELQIGAQAKSFVKDLATFNPNSPEFTQKLTDIQSLAQTQIVNTGSGTSRLLERQSSSLAGSKKNGGDATQKVAGSLAELRGVVQDLTPNAADLTGAKKFLSFIPGNKKVRRYFQRYESAQEQLDGIIKSLMAGQDELMKDNASLQQEKAFLWNAMGELNEYIILANKIDEEVEVEIERLRQNGNVAAAQIMDSDMLFAVRQRRQDLMTQLAVSVQGYMSMELVRKNNVELIKGVDRARTTTLYALRTAMVVAQALDSQRLVLDQIDAINEVTNNTIEQTALMLRQQTTRVHNQAVNSGVQVETLTKAFDNIFATMDEIDKFKAEANVKMGKTIESLQAQLDRAKPQLDRAIAAESAEGNSAQKALTL